MTSAIQVKSWSLATLAELVSDTRSGFASGERDDNGIVQVRMNNVDTSGLPNQQIHLILSMRKYKYLQYYLLCHRTREGNRARTVAISFSTASSPGSGGA